MSDVFPISHVAQLMFFDALENANGGGVGMWVGMLVRRYFRSKIWSSMIKYLTEFSKNTNLSCMLHLHVFLDVDGDADCNFTL